MFQRLKRYRQGARKAKLKIQLSKDTPLMVLQLLGSPGCISIIRALKFRDKTLKYHLNGIYKSVAEYNDS
jgi:hypothetical protein